MLKFSFSFGEFTLHPELRIIKKKGAAGEDIEIKLSQAETLIMVHFLTNVEQPFSRDSLLSIGWEGRPISPNSLPVAIGNLRKVFVNSATHVEIKSIPRAGYAFSVKSPILKLEHVDSISGVTAVDSAKSSLDGVTTEKLKSEKKRVFFLSDDFFQKNRANFFLWKRRIMMMFHLLVFSIILFFSVQLYLRWVPVNCESHSAVTTCTLSDKKHLNKRQELLNNVPDSSGVLLSVGDDYLFVPMKKED